MNIFQHVFTVVDGSKMAALYGVHFRKNKAIIIFVLNYMKMRQK